MLEYRQQEEFYVDDEFGEIPKGWTLKKFIKCFEFFPTASYSREQLSEKGDSCYIHYGDIHTKFDGFIDFKKDKLPFVDKTMASRFTKLKEGDLIIADASEDYDGVGKAVEVLNIENVDAIAGLHTLHLRAIDDCLVNGFKAYVLNNGAVRNKILRSATGIKVYSISKSSLKNILIPIPPPTEQRTIASILAKLDEAIAATKNSIAKAERLKKALMQNLLTGKLKPDGTWRKEDEFSYDEKVGFYPTEWNCNRFKEFSILQRGKDLTDNEVVSGDYPVVKSNGTTIHHNKYTCEPPGVVTGRSGTIGKVFFLEEKYWAHNTTLYVKDFRGNYEKYIFYLIQTMRFEKYYAGTTVPTLNRNDVHRVRVAIPKLVDEQKAICKLIDDAENILQSKLTKIKKMERLKKSLMQNLLSGKVRVKIKETVNG